VTSSLVVPYIQGYQKKFTEFGRNLEYVQHIMNYAKTKPKNGIQETKNHIYSIPCECRRKYIGETGRKFNTRIAEHTCNTRMGEIPKSKTAEHLSDEDHRIQWNKAEITQKEENRIIRKLKRVSIHQNRPSVNQA
jgi:hypothetical protein